MLADSLRMIVSQRLLRTTDGSRRVVAAEILVNTNAAKANIRSGSSHKLSAVIQAGGRLGMQTYESAVKELVGKGIVSADEASERMDGSPMETKGIPVEAA